MAPRPQQQRASRPEDKLEAQAAGAPAAPPEPAPQPDPAPAAQPDPDPAMGEVFDGAGVVVGPAVDMQPGAVWTRGTRVNLCPHCGGMLVRHEGEGPKAGAEHCNGCGCCFVDGELRPGHPACTRE